MTSPILLGQSWIFFEEIDSDLGEQGGVRRGGRRGTPAMTVLYLALTVLYPAVTVLYLALTVLPW